MWTKLVRITKLFLTSSDIGDEDVHLLLFFPYTIMKLYWVKILMLFGIQAVMLLVTVFSSRSRLKKSFQLF